jgi:formyltetrahydrofolate deformylase
MNETDSSAILLLSCPDQPGLVSRISNFIFNHGGNILDLDEHVDVENKHFFIRICWDLKNFSIPNSEVAEAFAPLLKEYNAKWEISFAADKKNVAVFVSKFNHCLQEILWRNRLGEFNITISVVVSNHKELQSLVEQYNIPFFFIPINVQNKIEQEKKQLKLLELYNIDTIVLARYMQILTSQIVKKYPNKIINIHHSFLPAFVGSNPYKQAYERGVKIIGATSHYVTEDLDNGPIIEQDVIHISHKDTVRDLTRKGRDIERLILARALSYHSENRILVHKNKTIVFV